MITRDFAVDVMRHHLDDDDLITILGFVSEETGDVPEFEVSDSGDEVSYVDENGESVRASYADFIKKYLDVEKVADLICDFDTLLDKLDSIDGKVYISIDMDVIDPAFAPSVGNPTPNGLHPLDIENIFESLANNDDVDIIGFDLVEVASDKLGDITAVLAAKIIYDFLTLFA